jgi:hypothetical protein
MIFPKMLTTNLHKARNENPIGAPTDGAKFSGHDPALQRA